MERPIKILQFGEGNFLRAFVDYMVDIANEKGLFGGDIVIVKPIEYGDLDAFKEQGCVYSVLLRDKNSVEERKITSVAAAVDSYSQYGEFMAYAKNPGLRFIVSNTTEAGIVYDETDKLELKPPNTYPGKLAKFLYERWQSKLPGLIILPVELIESNGQKLRECCLKLAGLWELPEDFARWLQAENIFCQTLVDRIVTGFEAGHDDKLFVTGEPFALWVIESQHHETVSREFPLDKAGLPVIFTDDLTPYRERKVRLLNGAHTAAVPAAYLAGLDTVGELMADRQLRALLERGLFGELSPNVPLPPEKVAEFAASVIERFENPFVRHGLLSITLNSVSKWRARVLPSLRDGLRRTGRLPPVLAFSLAALMAFYSGGFSGGKLLGKRNGESYEILDDAPVLEFFAAHHRLPPDAFARLCLGREDFWGEDLNALPGLGAAVASGLRSIRDGGVRKAVAKLLETV